MSYDIKRSLKYGALAAGGMYFGSAIVEKIVQSTPVLSDDKYRAAATAAVVVIAADVVMQSGVL
jgi:hypothetical protein